MLPSEWFNEDASASVRVTVRYSGAVSSSDVAGSVTLRHSVSPPPLTSSGMSLTMARAPLYPGDTFQASVDAHTGPASYALLVWRLTLRYDVTVVRLQSWSYSTTYQTPTDFHDDAAGELIVLASGLRDGVSNDIVTGQSALRLVDLTFQVLSSATAEIGRAHV